MFRSLLRAQSPASTSKGAKLYLLGLFLLVFGAKVIVIDRFGSDLPYWDQWGKQADLVIAPWLERGHAWESLWVPHNEHRIVPTLGMNVALVIATGQWDARLECVANALLHAWIVVGLAGWFFKRCASPFAAGAGLILASAAAVPIDYENVLGGFQSQFYFMIGFSLLSMGGLLTTRPYSWAWLGGLLTGMLSVISMGSGFICGPVTLLVAASRIALQRERLKHALPTLLAAALITAVGLYLRPPAPWHNVLHAQSVSIFIEYTARCLAWPYVSAGWISLFLWLPWVIVFADHLARRRSADAWTTEFLIAGGLWTAAQAAAVAYYRAAEGGQLPASRYGEVFLLGLFFAGASLTLLLSRASDLRIRLMAGLWCVVVLGGIVVSSTAVWKGPLRERGTLMTEGEQNVQAYVLTGDFTHLDGRIIPYPLPNDLRRFLDRPSIRTILPPSVRPPIAVPGLDSTLTEKIQSTLPPLSYRHVRVLLGGEEWRSEVIAPGDGWWKIETAGDVGIDTNRLELVSAKTDKSLGKITPTKVPRASWRAAYIRAPREPAYIVARAATGGAPIGVSEPIAMSTASYWGWQLTRQGTWLIAIGALSLALSFVGRYRHLRARHRVGEDHSKRHSAA